MDNNGIFFWMTRCNVRLTHCLVLGPQFFLLYKCDCIDSAAAKFAYNTKIREVVKRHKEVTKLYRQVNGQRLKMENHDGQCLVLVGKNIKKQII